MKNSHISCGDKKLWDLRLHIENALYEIMIHRITWLLILKVTFQYLYHDSCPRRNILNAPVDSPVPLRKCKSF